MAFNMFPYSDFHRLNADWILKTVAAAAEAAETAAQAAETAAATAAGFDGRITALESASTSQGTSITNLQSAVSGLSDDVTTLTTAVSSITSSVTSLSSSVASLSESVTSLAGSVSSIESRVHSLESSMSNVQQRVTTNASLVYDDGAFAVIDPLDTSLSTAAVVDNLIDTVSEGKSVVLTCYDPGSYPGAPSGSPVINLAEIQITTFKHIDTGGDVAALIGYASFNAGAMSDDVIVVTLSISAGVATVSVSFVKQSMLPAAGAGDLYKMLYNGAGGLVWIDMRPLFVRLNKVSDAWTATSTPAEILEAINTGRQVYARQNAEGEPWINLTRYVVTNDALTAITFNGLDATGAGREITYVNGAWDVDEY
jgi:uncharacterized protein YoxC